MGSSAGTSTTVCFLYVLARFPGFLQHVKKEGAALDVVARLTTYYNFNVSLFILSLVRTLNSCFTLFRRLASYFVFSIQFLCLLSPSTQFRAHIRCFAARESLLERPTYNLGSYLSFPLTGLLWVCTNLPSFH